MPRRRMIDPQIWRNEKVGSLSDAGRLLFIGIFSQADDDGRLKASPRFLKATIFPYDDDKSAEYVRQLRDQCAECGLLRVYSNGREEYLDLPGWSEHQQIRKDRYSPSSLPAFEVMETLTTSGQPYDNHTAPNGCPNLIKSSLVKSKPPYNSPLQGETHQHSKKERELFDLWNSLNVIKCRKLTGDMTRAIKATLRDFSAVEISQAMKNYAHIVNDEQYFFKYRWTMKNFLKRGLEMFLDLEVAQNNYRKGGANGKSRKQREQETGASGRYTKAPTDEQYLRSYPANQPPPPTK